MWFDDFGKFVGCQSACLWQSVHSFLCLRVDVSIVFVERLANYEAERIIVDGKLFDGASLRVDGASPCMILVSVALHALLPHVLHLKTSRWRHARI